MSGAPRRGGSTLLTGGSGFVGHVLTAELLRRGHRCRLLLRGAPRDADAATDRLLGELGLDAEDFRRRGSLETAVGSLPDDIPAAAAAGSDRIVHCAAVVRFETDGSGEPERTNGVGTERLLAWAAEHGVREFHLVSTAYSCGRIAGPTPERVVERPPAFRNPYELSKWNAERHAAAWARGPERSCTIYRPSIVVGDHATGRATRFNGLYPALHAFERCTRGAGDRAATAGLRRMPLRIEGDPAGRLNLAPVDHVAGLIAAVVDDPGLQGGVYNLVDPAPLSNQTLLEMIERYFGVTGCRFDPTPAQPPAGLAQSFAAYTRSLRPYIVETPEFDRGRTEALERRLGRPWPAWDERSVRGLIDFAHAANWGRRRTPDAPPTPSDPVAAYFETFLPERAPRSMLSSMTSLDTTFCFIVHGVPDGAWVCRFIRGRLAGTPRRMQDPGVDFTYRMDAGAFFDIVGAKADPQDVFLQGRAEVSGNIELALKMGMILEQFNREHPYIPDAAGARTRSPSR